MATAMVEDPNLEDDQLSSMTADDIVRASRLLDNEIRVLKVTDLHIFFFKTPTLNFEGFYSFASFALGT